MNIFNRDVLRWGKNIGSAKTRTKKRAGVAVYNRASSLETLVSVLVTGGFLGLLVYLYTRKCILLKLR